MRSRTLNTSKDEYRESRLSPIPNPLAQLLVGIVALIAAIIPLFAPLLVLLAAVYQRLALLLLPLSIPPIGVLGQFLGQYRMVIIAITAFALLFISFTQRIDALKKSVKGIKPSGQQSPQKGMPAPKPPTWQPLLKVVAANPYLVIIPAVMAVGVYEGNTGTLVVSSLALMAELKGWTVRQGVMLLTAFVASVFPPAAVLLGVSKISEWSGETVEAVVKPLAEVSVAVRDAAKKMGIRLPPRVVFTGDTEVLSVTGLMSIVKTAVERTVQRASIPEEEINVEVIFSRPEVVFQTKHEPVQSSILETLRRVSDALEKIPVRPEDPRVQFRPPFIVGRDGITPFLKLIPDYRHEHTREWVKQMPVFPRVSLNGKFEASIPIGISDHNDLPPWRVVKEGSKYNIRITPRSRAAFFNITPRAALHTLIAAGSGGGKSVVVYAITNTGTWGVLRHILDESVPPLPIVTCTVIDGKGDAIKALPDSDIYLARQKIVGGVDPVPLVFWYMAIAQAANYRMQVPSRFLEELRGDLGDWLNKAFPLDEWWDKVVLVPQFLNGKVGDWKKLPDAVTLQNPPSHEIGMLFSLMPYLLVITDEFLDLTTNLRNIKKYAITVTIGGEERQIEINPSTSFATTLQSILVTVRSAGVGVIVTTQKTKKEEYSIGRRNVRDSFGTIVSNLKPHEWTSLGLSPRQFTGDRNVPIPTYSWAASTQLVGVGDADGDKLAKPDSTVFYLPEVTPGRIALPPAVVYNWFNWFMQQTPAQIEAEGYPPMPGMFVKDIPIGVQLMLGDLVHTPLGEVWCDLCRDIPLLHMKMWGCAPYDAMRLKPEEEYRAEWERYKNTTREKVASLIENGRGSPAKITQVLAKIEPPSVVEARGDERQFMSLARPYALDKKEEVAI